MCKRLLVFLVCFLFVSNVMAEGVERASIIHEGTPGIFFCERIATKMLLDLEEFKVQTKRIQLLNTKLDLQAEKILLLEQDIELSNTIADKYKSSYELEHKLRLSEADAYEKRLAAKDAWYRAPALWFSVGFVVSAALAVGLSFSLQTVRN